MSLAAAVAEHATLKKGPPCTVMLVRDKLSREDQNDLDRLIADRSVTSAAIERGLAKLGHKLTQHTVARHRRGDCGCAR